MVFGKVLDGMDVVEAIEKQGSHTGRPTTSVVIRDCGELKVET